MFKTKKIFLQCAIVAVLLCTVFVFASNSVQANANKHTAMITEKSAEWSNEANYEADLTLKVNGSQFAKSQDVVFVLDRSGSMDMEYIQEGNMVELDASGNKTQRYVGSHVASSPCLNPDHFYFQKKRDAEPNEIPTDPDTTKIYPNADNTEMIVYNNQEVTIKARLKANSTTDTEDYASVEAKWVVLDMTKPVNHYHLFAHNQPERLSGGKVIAAVDGTYNDAAYHFKKVGDSYERISTWDTTDTRSGASEGLWDHADEAKGCYDRWLEAKAAVKKFAAELLKQNETYGLDNKISVVPFSGRDATLHNFLNKAKTLQKEYLVNSQQSGTYDYGLDIDASGNILPYDSKVNWTDDATTVSNAVDKLFTTANTDYVYGLSEAYNMIQSRTDKAKEEKDVTVILLSDGKPDPSGNQTLAGLTAFANRMDTIRPLANAIKGSTDEVIKYEGDPLFANFWNSKTTARPRHDVLDEHLVSELDENGNSVYVGVYGTNSRILTVGYMMENELYNDQLREIATDPVLDHIQLDANAQDSTSGVLADKVFEGFLTAGGRQAVLRDTISKYYYIPEGVNIPNVEIEGTKETGQTIVWTIGNIFEYTEAEQPTITVPLVLREEYRDVEKVTYYPTNADNPEPDLYTPDRGVDDGDTGAKLYYKDPAGDDRIYTIGTPKLPVKPKVTEPEIPVDPKDPKDPEEPKDPIIQLPSKDTTSTTVLPSVAAGDRTKASTLLLIGGLSLVAVAMLLSRRRQVKTK